MKRDIFRIFLILIVGFLACLFININGGFAQDSDFIIKYDAAFTIRDNLPPDGDPDDIDDDPSDARFWGLITNSASQDDEFFLEFDIRNIEPLSSAKFYFFFSKSFPDFDYYPDQTINLTVADYKADGIPDINKFGIGNDFADVLISDIRHIHSIDVTDIINSYINSGISYLGIRLHSPISSIPTTGKPAQLGFAIGNLEIISPAETEELLEIISPDETEELVDILHPTGAVHAISDHHWPLHKKRVRVKISGYVLDELSMAKDEGGTGVSFSFLKINDRKIVLKDDTTNLLDKNGRFNLDVWLRTKKRKVNRIGLYAADTAIEGPNFGLVDSTIVRVPYKMSKKSKHKAKKFKKKSKH